MRKLFVSFLAIMLTVLCVSAQDEFCIIGPAVTGGWHFNELNNNQLEKQADGKYSITLSLNSGNFRINQKGEWWPAYVPKNADNQNIAKAGGTYDARYATGETDTFLMEEAGVYTVELDITDGDNPKVRFSRQGEAAPNLWLVGAATLAGWDPSASKNLKMNRDERSYTWFGPLTTNGDGRFVFLANEGQWWPRYTNSEDTNKLELTAGEEYAGLKKFTGNADNPAFGVKSSGVYMVNVNLDENLESGKIRLEEGTLSLVGPAAGGWDTGIRINWTKSEDGIYTYTGDFNEGELRINKQGDWWPCFTTTSGSNQDITAEGGDFDLMWGTGDGPKSFNMTAAGKYTLTLDVAKMSLNVKAANEVVTPDPVTPPDIWLIGAATPGGWDLNNSKKQKMDREGNTYTWTGPLTQFGDRGRFVFITSEGKYQPRFVPKSGANPETITVGTPCEIVHESSDNPTFFVAVPAVYKVTITLNDDMEGGILNIENAPICLSGPAVSGSWSAGDLAKNEFAFDNGKYTWTGDVRTDALDQYTGSFRINLSGKWNPSFWPVGDGQIPAEGGELEAKWVNGDQSARFQFAEAGNYTVTLDLTTASHTTPTVIVTRNSSGIDPDPEVPDHDPWPVPSALYMVGSAMNGTSGTWGLEDKWLCEMTPTENENEFSWTGHLYAKTDANANTEFKLLYSRSWEPAYVTTIANCPIADGETYPLVYRPDGSVPDNKFIVPVSGIYTLVVKVDEYKPTMTVTLVEEQEIEPNKHIYLTGGATPCGWSTGNAIEMTTSDGELYTWTGEILTKDDACFRFLTSRNWYPTYTTTMSAKELVEAGEHAIRYDAEKRNGEPAFQIAKSGIYTVNLNIDPEVMSMQLILNSPKYATMSMTGTAVEGSTIDMKAVSPSRFVAFTELNPGTYTFKGVDKNNADVELGIDDSGKLVSGGAAINVSEKQLVRIALTSTSDNDIYEVTPIKSLNIKGSIVPDNVTLAYAGNGVWSSEVTLDKATPTSTDYPNRNFYFLFNNDENLAVRRHRGTAEVDMAIDGYNGLENIRLNQGTYTVTLDMRSFTYGIDADIDPLRVSVFGSSVANGQGADQMQGYAYLYGEQLKQRYADGLSKNALYTSGVSIGGNTTTDLLNRYDDILHDFSKYVVIGLSLGNEGIHGASDQQSVFNQFRDNMLSLIAKLRDDGKEPVVVNNYTRSDYNSSDYSYVKQMNMLIHSWNVPSFNALGSIDDGAGHWAEGYIADAFHPNTAGHCEFMYSLVPSIFDALIAGKPLPVRDTTAEMVVDNRTTIKLAPEGTVHSFTVSVRVKGTGAGNIISFGDRAISVDDNGCVSYTTDAVSRAGNVSSSAAVLNDGQWHDIALSHYHARGITILYIDGKDASETSERMTLEGNITFGESPRTFSEISFWRAGMNEDEMTAQHNGDMLKSSLELYSPMKAGEDGKIANLAQSTNSLEYTTTSTSSEDTPGVDGLSFQVVTSPGAATFYGPEIPANVYYLDGRLAATVTPTATGNTINLCTGVYISGNNRFFVR